MLARRSYWGTKLITRNLTDVVDELQKNGYPVAQMRWFPKEAPDFPYCVLIPDGTDNIFTDNEEIGRAHV